MNLCADYYNLAREEEKVGLLEAALIHYLSSLFSGFCSGKLPYQATEKIRRLQNKLLISDEQLLSCVHSYGHLSDADCRNLLAFSMAGDLAGIKGILSPSAGRQEDL